MNSRLIGCLTVWISCLSLLQAEDSYKQAREKLVRTRIASAGVTHEAVLESMRTTPRHQFVPRKLWDQAYYDMALPIGDSQTISSPFIVAHMTEALDPKPTDVVLEIGTGSGYQAAVLSPLVAKVYTIEIVEDLGIRAANTLSRLGYENVFAKVGDGFLGWPDAAPFDKIIVTCSPESVPQPLIDQLREGGRMIIPVGERYQQTLYLMEKRDGDIVRTSLRPTLFVPMTGEAESARVIQPDPTNPSVVNGDFSDGEVGGEHVPGWYYGRQMTLSSDSPGGNQFIRFSNETPDRNSHALQGLALDGRAVGRVNLGCRVRTEQVRAGSQPDALPVLAITFYDEKRRELGTYWMGPFIGSLNWSRQARSFRVPPKPGRPSSELAFSELPEELISTT